MIKSSQQRPIAVFDSGIGGLTVLRQLVTDFPHESFVYLGDTARLPYGTKSPATVCDYAVGLCDILERYNPKAYVVACNTASAHALRAVTARVGPQHPVVGMIDPAARDAVMATRNGHIAVLATNGTIRAQAYTQAISRMAPAVRVSGIAAQLLVALAEEGWHSKEVARAILRDYLAPALEADVRPDTLILGCTHFPLFTEMIGEIMGPDVTLIHCGTAAARALATYIPSRAPLTGGTQQLTFLVTDGLENFTRSARVFFGDTITPDAINLVDYSRTAA